MKARKTRDDLPFSQKPLQTSKNTTQSSQEESLVLPKESTILRIWLQKSLLSELEDLEKVVLKLGQKHNFEFKFRYIFL